MIKNKLITGFLTGAVALSVAFTGVAPEQAHASASTTKAVKINKYYKSTATVKMRKGGSTSFKQVGTLTKGKTVHAYKRKKTKGTYWYKVKYNGKAGWVTGKYLKKTVKKASNASGNAIINAGRPYIGTPYVWGGTTPRGFDCSGFTSYVYKKAGMKTLPRTSGQQKAAVKRVSSPKVGDLIFFSANPGGSRVTHVGIYAGNNTVMHAAGNSVKFQSLAGYWDKRVISYGTTR